MRFSNSSVLSLAALSLSFVVSTSAFADPVVVNGGFESGTDTFAHYASGTAIPGWKSGGNLNNTGVDGVAGPDTNFLTHSGLYSAILGPDSSGGPGTLSQTIVDHAGDIDSLHFFLASECFTGPSCYSGALGNLTQNTFSYSVGGTTATLPANLVETGNGTNGTYTQYSLNFLATGSDTILFKFTNDDDYFSLDDVSVSIVTPSTSSPTPEPSSLVLLGTGVLGLAGMARRRFLNA